MVRIRQIAHHLRPNSIGALLSRQLVTLRIDTRLVIQAEEADSLLSIARCIVRPERGSTRNHPEVVRKSGSNSTLASEQIVYNDTSIYTRETPIRPLEVQSY